MSLQTIYYCCRADDSSLIMAGSPALAAEIFAGGPVTPAGKSVGNILDNIDVWLGSDAFGDHLGVAWSDSSYAGLHRPDFIADPSAHKSWSFMACGDDLDG